MTAANKKYIFLGSAHFLLIACINHQLNLQIKSSITVGITFFSIVIYLDSVRYLKIYKELQIGLLIQQLTHKYKLQI